MSTNKKGNVNKIKKEDAKMSTKGQVAKNEVVIQLQEDAKEIEKGNAKTEVVLTTKEVAARFNVTTKALRRQLRSMEKFKDGIYTNYKWTSWEDETLKTLIKHYEGKDKKEVAIK